MKPPIIVRTCQILSLLFIALCALRVTAAITGGHDSLIYGKTLLPFWVDVILALAVTLALRRSARRDFVGLIACSFPMALWLGLTFASPESWTAWHWLPDGGPREPDGIPYAYSYMFRYETHEALVGAAFMTVIKELILATALGRLLAGQASRSFYSFEWRSPLVRAESGRRG